MNIYKTKIYSEFISSITLWDSSAQSISDRLIVVILGFVISFGAICYKLVHIASSGYHDRAHFSKSQIVRREVVDRFGNLLAVNVPLSALFANPQHMINIEKDVEKLAKVLPSIDTKKLISELGKKNKTFLWVKHDITPTEEKLIRDLGIVGLYFEHYDKRVYTHGPVTSHVLGYVGRDNVGLAGIEKYHDKFLTSQEKGSSSPLRLTLDVRVQNIVSEEIDKVMAKFDPTGAIGVVVEVNTGEVVALVSKPDFDPHRPSDASPDALFNKASLGIYEAGSGLKAFTLAIGLDTNTIGVHDAYDLTNFRVANFQLQDYHKAVGWHSVGEIFLHSSNIGSAQIALETGSDNFQDYFRKMKLLHQLEIEIPERGTPLYPKTAKWSDLTLATISYGYGIAISPLHFVQAMLPTVNGGIFRPLTLISKDSNVSKHDEEVRIFKKTTSDAILKFMRLVVENGTGRKAAVPGYLVGGKTGTANIQSGNQYVKNNRRSSFFGVFPVIDPKYAVYVMVNEPKGRKDTFGFATSGWTAAPAVGAIISRMAAVYGMKPYDEQDPEIKEKLHIDYQINADT